MIINIANKSLAKMYKNGIFMIMLIIFYVKQDRNDQRKQKLVFECADCRKIFNEANNVFFASKLFKLARDKDKALLKFVSILNDMGDEVIDSSYSFDDLRDFLCFCNK